MDIAYILGPLFLIFVLFIFCKKRTSVTLPPGPQGWFGLGNLFGYKMDNLHLVVEKWGQQHGHIYTGTLLGTKFVFLNNADLIRKAVASVELENCLNDRPPMFVAYHILNDSDIIFGRFSKELIKLRKIFHGALKAYGEGLQRFENLIHAEINSLIEKLNKSHEENVDLKTHLKDSLSNVVSIMLCGQPFEEDNPEMNVFWEFDNWGQRLSHPSIDRVLLKFPFLRFCPGKYGDTCRKTEKAKELLLNRFYHQMKKSYRSGEIRGMSDVFFSVKESNESKGEMWFNDDHIQALIQDVVAAALTTTFESLTGLFLVLLHRQDIQLSMQSEIDRVIGRSRSPTIQDRHNMPYTQAVILEILRYTSVLPLSVPHYCSKDVVLNGYTITKGSYVLPYLWGIHHDEGVWENPWKVDPTRFLDDEGNLIPPEHTKRHNLLPFGVGRRHCPGESFAKSRMFLYVTSLLQRFNFLPSDGVTLPTPDPRHYQTGGVTLVPPDYVCRIQRRV